MKYRICYEKKDSLIFISQLDLQKVFQRAFRRTRIQLEYTQGFHPHPKMTYSPPLPLFVASKEEYLDVALVGEFDAQEIKERLTKTLPRDLIIVSVEPVTESTPSLSSILVWGNYEIILCAEDENKAADAANALSEYMNGTKEILITKLNKKKQTVTKDILPLVKNFSVRSNGCEIIINADLSLLNDSLLSAAVFTGALKDNVTEAKELVTKSITKLSAKM
ncbi:MAG: DUF2344 domain-containing protein [Anaerofustis stercorihominis]|nr:DUF2344 domain-containing protein [Anaerofustis stercorihominis]